MSGRFQLKSLPEKQRIKLIGELYDALSCVRNRRDARQVFRDLLTVSEIAMLARRVQIVLLLRKGLDLRLISQTLKIGLNTIVSVKKKFETSEGGYELICRHLERLEAKRSRKQRRRRTRRFLSDDYLLNYFMKRSHMVLLNELVSLLKERGEGK